jgi:NADPH-dependent 7-cyano-7-deazaguanine reductase QueF
MEIQLYSWQQSFRNYKAFRNDKEDAVMASLFSSVKLIKLLVKQKRLLLVNIMIKVATERHTFNFHLFFGLFPLFSK